MVFSILCKNRGGWGYDVTQHTARSVVVQLRFQFEKKKMDSKRICDPIPIDLSMGQPGSNGTSTPNLDLLLRQTRMVGRTGTFGLQWKMDIGEPLPDQPNDPAPADAPAPAAANLPRPVQELQVQGQKQRSHLLTIDDKELESMHRQDLSGVLQHCSKEESVLVKAKRRKLRNRASSIKYRSKMKTRLNDLENENASLSGEVNRLQLEVTRLTWERDTYKLQCDLMSTTLTNPTNFS